MSEFFLDADVDLDAKRARLQKHINQLEQKIRRRLRGKIRAVDRGPYDLDDIMASVRQRVDLALVNGNIHAGSEDELDGYIFRITERLAIDARRRINAQHIESADLERLSASPDRPGSEATENAHRVMDALSNDEREAIRLWQQGYSQERIAALQGIGVEAQRSRWRRLWNRIRK